MCSRAIRARSGSRWRGGRHDVRSVIEQLVAGARAASWAELASLALGLGYAVLAVRQDRRCWIFGGLSSAILAVLAWQARLPMQGLLQAAYVLLSVYGYRRWSGADLAVDRVRRWSGARNGVVLLVVALLGLLLAPLVDGWTQAAWPRLDTITLVASLLATWMVAQLLIENWIYWIVIDAVCIFLYGAQGLPFIALLYAAYLVIAVFGWFAWRRRLAA